MKAHYDSLTEYMLIHANPHFYHPLTYYERCQIDVLWNQAHLHNMAEITRILHRPEWTINREIRRVQHFQDHHSTKQRKLPKRFRNYHYDASLAQELADQRKQSKTLPRADKYTIKQGEVIADKILNHHWSPRAIAQRCPEVNVSHQTIYTWIKAGRIPNVSLTDLNNPLHERHNPKHLSNSMRKLKQQARKQQQPEVMEEQRVSARQRRILIEERPKTVDQRKYFGHWEVDCVVPRRGGHKVIVTFAERKTRYYQCFIAEQQNGLEIVKVLQRFWQSFGANAHHIIKSMTFDNGPEFVNHDVMDCLEYELRIKAYYCHPYSPEERGTNEHCNRMLRQYIPKGTSFERLIDRDVQAVAREINERPRQILHGKTAQEAFEQQLKRIARYQSRKNQS